MSLSFTECNVDRVMCMKHDLLLFNVCDQIMYFILQINILGSTTIIVEKIFFGSELGKTNFDKRRA